MLTLGRLKQLLEYSPGDGVFVWRVNRRGRFARTGEVAGKLNDHGYIRIGIDGRIYLAHRLAWFYCHGEWPLGGMDHANGMPTDNRIANLRLATPSQNVANSRARNSARLKGAYYKPKMMGPSTVFDLGETAEAANAAYMAAAREAFGVFARAK
jgi:hypothetical protein